MAKQLDVVIQEFKEGLADYVNSSPLTLEIKRLVMFEYLDRVTKTSIAFIAKESEAEAKKSIEEKIDHEKEGVVSGKEI